MGFLATALLQGLCLQYIILLAMNIYGDAKSQLLSYAVS